MAGYVKVLDGEHSDRDVPLGAGAMREVHTSNDLRQCVVENLTDARDDLHDITVKYKRKADDAAHHEFRLKPGQKAYVHGGNIQLEFRSSGEQTVSYRLWLLN